MIMFEDFARKLQPVADDAFLIVIGVPKDSFPPVLRLTAIKGVDVFLGHDLHTYDGNQFSNDGVTK